METYRHRVKELITYSQSYVHNLSTWEDHPKSPNWNVMYQKNMVYVPQQPKDSVKIQIKFLWVKFGTTDTTNITLKIT